MDWDPDEADAMLANTTVDIKNGVLSFENPNYTLSAALNNSLNLNGTAHPATEDLHSHISSPPVHSRLDGGLSALDTLYSELDHVTAYQNSRTITGGESLLQGGGGGSVVNRRHYAQLDIESMGVDVTTGPVTNLDRADRENNRVSGNVGMMGRRRGTTNYTTDDVIENSPPLHFNQQHQSTSTIHQQFNNSQQNKINKNEVLSDKSSMDANEFYLEDENELALATTNSSSNTSNLTLQNADAISDVCKFPQQEIPHMTPLHSNDLYALPMKKPPNTFEDTSTLDSSEKKEDCSLPPGWEKHEDNDGPYYWHIKSGTITRTPPATMTPQQPEAPLRSERINRDSDTTSGGLTSSVTRSNTSSALSELSEARPRGSALDNAYKRRSYPARSDLTAESGNSRPIRFAVRSLGWVEIAEEDLTPERSSKAVNRCIVDLSVGNRRDLLDVVGQWGDGKDLFMDLDEGSLKLVDPENLTVLNTQPIHTIRVWGVGRDNGRERDFAYVARDRITRKHMCHVFRCDTPARTIANTLRDICKKIMIERSLQQTMMNRPMDGVSISGGGVSSGVIGAPASGRLARPTNLPTEQRRLHKHSQIIPTQSFPTPMEEPKKIIKAQYVGVIQVTKPTGMDVLHAAIQVVTDNNPRPWKQVLVVVAPSTITVTNADDGRQVAECRVRYLSFLGIGQDVKHCAFIMHTAQDQFLAYVFHCEPSSGALCKTIEAACKLRYQKCLDAHPGGATRRREMNDGPRTLSSTIRSMFTNITGRKARSAES